MKNKIVAVLVAFIATLTLGAAAAPAAQAYWHVEAAYAECETHSFGSADATFNIYGKQAYRWGAAQVGYNRVSSSRVRTTLQWVTTDGTMTVLADCDTSGSSQCCYSWYPSNVTVHSIGLRNLRYS